MSSIQQAPSPVRHIERCTCTSRVRTFGCAMAAETSSVPLLRRLACRVVREWHLPESVEEAVGLIVTELTSNAVRHSGSSDVVLRIAAFGGRLVLHVKDFGHWRVPAPSAPAEEACSGRGLDLVGAFAAHSEIVATTEGTRVVAEILLPPPMEPRCRIGA
ncbi:ATP-binding protein [Streptomyces sp. NPDC057027]|uniref:ATP-binding protein n=1 Tax=Streptomyces sp. NPDC057027 TaxID=3346004 RepID=UPI0036332796